MRILVVATKSPWPPNDGGRLALWSMLKGLVRAGQTVALLAPTVAAPDDDTLAALRRVCEPHLIATPSRSWFASAADALLSDRSVAMARHRHAVLETALMRLLDAWRPDLLHAEQLQAFASVAAALRAGLPVVLRAQNVESSLWEQAARRRPWTRLLEVEAARLRREEARALQAAARVLAITARDAEHLRALAGPGAAARVHALSPPFAAELAAGPALPGAPAIALAGSRGWWPNREGTRWMLDEVMPGLATQLPQARLHVFGHARRRSSNVVAHPAPRESFVAFPADSIAVVPLRSGSGIRMRILEAWARGLPVVATSAAATGLDVTSGRELLLADTPEHFVAAIDSLHRDPALRAALIGAGRDYLARHHDPARQTQALLAHYRAAVAGANE